MVVDCLLVGSSIPLRWIEATSLQNAQLVNHVARNRPLQAARS